MGQPRIVGAAAAVIIAVVAFMLVGRWKHGIVNPAPAGGVRIASVTPAGTDLVIGIGAGDRLVGVSNFDGDREGTAGKPRVGDYQNINWEKLAGLGANVLLLQYAQDRVPGYIQQKCADMGIKIVNLKLDSIDEIYAGMMTLADAIGAGAGPRCGRGIAGEAGWGAGSGRGSAAGSDAGGHG